MKTKRNNNNGRRPEPLHGLIVNDDLHKPLVRKPAVPPIAYLIAFWVVVAMASLIASVLH